MYFYRSFSKSWLKNKTKKTINNHKAAKFTSTLQVNHLSKGPASRSPRIHPLWVSVIKEIPAQLLCLGAMTCGPWSLTNEYFWCHNKYCADECSGSPPVGYEAFCFFLVGGAEFLQRGLQIHLPVLPSLDSVSFHVSHRVIPFIFKCVYIIMMNNISFKRIF